VQETLLRAARYRGRQVQPDRLRPWLVQIAANVLRDHTRRVQRTPLIGCEGEVLAQVEDSAPAPGLGGREGTIQLGGERVDVDLALHLLAVSFPGLVERDRAVLASYYGGSGTTAATARECGLHPSLVKIRLFRARRRLERMVCQRASERRTRLLLASA